MLENISKRLEEVTKRLREDKAGLESGGIQDAGSLVGREMSQAEAEQFGSTARQGLLAPSL